MRLRHLLFVLLSLLPLPGVALVQSPVRAVPQLDVSRYAGQWHEIAHLPVSFQKKCRGDITASYTLRDDGLIGVRNSCRTGDGTLAAADGVARPVPGQPGQLQVRFAPDWLAWLPWVWADYWVIALDPDYQWALVGEPSRKYLWILSRSPQMERAQFEQIKAHASRMGYDLSALIVAAPLQ
ncbi:lipocalin family protein [Xanthomonas maliensis]|uniref:lipocalin family protein n=1 Tax=Xanthomonas maliensis TaxID=1321368 RepID=UPI0003A3B509|nr:lipocalin family protein [Xanthomonas maliensis]